MDGQNSSSDGWLGVIVVAIVGFIWHVFKIIFNRWNSQHSYKGYIYFIQGVSGGPIKIGYSKNPQKRLATFQTSHSERLVILGCVKGNIAYERQLHKQFSAYRIRGNGEWFRPGREIVVFIRQNCFPM